MASRMARATATAKVRANASRLQVVLPPMKKFFSFGRHVILPDVAAGERFQENNAGYMYVEKERERDRKIEKEKIRETSRSSLLRWRESKSYEMKAVA